MGIAVADNFVRANGPLGVSSSGFPWEVVRGSVTISGNKGLAQNTSPGPFAVMDLLFAGHDASVSIAFPAGGHGQAIYFRVKDVQNHWRFFHHYYTQTFCSTDAAGVTTCETYGYVDMILQKCTAGSYTQVGRVSGGVGSMNITMRGDLIECRGGGAATLASATSTLFISVTDSYLAKETKHGFGYWESTQNGNAGIGAFDARPFHLGNYTPPLYL